MPALVIVGNDRGYIPPAPTQAAYRLLPNHTRQEVPTLRMDADVDLAGRKRATDIPAARFITLRVLNPLVFPNPRVRNHAQNNRERQPF